MREQKGRLYKQGQYWCVRYLGHGRVKGRNGVERGIERKYLFHRLVKRVDWPQKDDVKKGPFREFMARINAQAKTGRVVVAMTVAEFVEEVYLPYVEAPRRPRRHMAIADPSFKAYENTPERKPF